MKKLSIWISVTVAVVAVTLTAVALVVMNRGNAGGDYTKAVDDNSVAVVRFDTYQVLQKSGAYNELVNIIKAELQKEGAPSYIVSLADDLRNSGIDVQAPMYAYATVLDNSVGLAAVVAKVHSKVKLNQLANMIVNEANLSKHEYDDCTVIPIDKNVAIAYNDVAIIFGGVEALGYSRPTKSIEAYLTEALNNAANGAAGGSVLPAYEGSDIAACFNLNSLIDILKLSIQESYNSDIAQSIAQLEQIRNSKFDLAMNFAQGSIDLSAQVSNLPDFGYQFTPCTDENLKYVSADAWAVANLPLDGSVGVKQLKDMFAQDSNMRNLINQELASATNGMVNNVQSVMTIAEPLISSLKGNLTAAINNVTISQVYDPYYYNDRTDSYGGMRLKEEVDACAIVNVTNNSIWNFAQNWITMIPNLKQVGSSMYMVEEDDLRGYFGQQNNALFASTPNPLVMVANPATQAVWYPEVKDGYGYAVINLAAILANPTVRNEAVKEIESELGSSSYGAIQLLDSLNYLVCNVDAPGSMSLRLVLKNNRENVLTQLVNMVKVEIMKELNGNY